MQKSDDVWLWDNTQTLSDDGGLGRLGLAKAFSRCFSGVDGELVLDHLRNLTLGRALGAQADPQALRHLEGQRQLVLYIANLVDRGSTPL